MSQPMGFSGFALKGKKKRKLLPVGGQDNDDDNNKKKRKEEEEGELPSSGGLSGEGASFTIPKQQDTFVPGMGDRRFNSERYLPEAADDWNGDSLKGLQQSATTDKFVAVKENADDDEGKAAAGEPNPAAKQYGLQVVRGSRKRPSTSSGAPPTGRPRQRQPASQEDNFKQEMQDLPDDVGVESEAYERMPIEHFGKAMMRGMGWEEGRGVGRNAKEDVKVVEFLSRPDRLGLGAQPKLTAEKKPNWINKPGEEKREKKLLAAAGNVGKVKHTRTLDEKMVEYKGPGVHVGKKMVVVAGKHEGLKCQVLEILPRERGRSEYSRVRLLASQKVVEVRSKELEDVSSLNGSNKLSGGEMSKAKSSKSSSSHGHKKHKSRSMEQEPWLYSNLRVRVVDKHLKRGKAYLKKAVIVDVLEPGKGELVQDDNGERLSGVHQDCLETVVPKQEGTVLLVVRGKLRGKKCKLLQRSTAQGKATVQFTGDMSVKEMRLDDVCEYVCGEDEEE